MKKIVIFSPDGSGILVVPKLRDYEIQRTAGGFVLEKAIILLL
jgi:hypothetical protein